LELYKTEMYSDLFEVKYIGNGSAGRSSRAASADAGPLAYAVITPGEIPLFGVSKQRFKLVP